LEISIPENLLSAIDMAPKMTAVSALLAFLGCALIVTLLDNRKSGVWKNPVIPSIATFFIVSSVLSFGFSKFYVDKNYDEFYDQLEQEQNVTIEQRDHIIQHSVFGNDSETLATIDYVDNQGKAGTWKVKVNYSTGKITSIETSNTASTSEDGITVYQLLDDSENASATDSIQEKLEQDTVNDISETGNE
jgi:hypothetical protein